MKRVLHLLSSPGEWHRALLRARHEIRRGNLLAATGAWLRNRAPAIGTYRQWIARYDTLSADDMTTIATRISALAAPPVFSIITPVHDPAPGHLSAMLHSVRQQIYPHWELILVDNGCRDSKVRDILHDAASSDPRIKRIASETNLGIARANNLALGVASGTHIAFLDHDDTLAQHALATAALALGSNPHTRVLYSDEDKLDAQGRRIAPYMKPAFDPILLLGQNYMCHFLVVEAVLLRTVGGFRENIDGAQDHDLALRISESVEEASILHLPFVLYHWRMHSGSTASALTAKRDIAALTSKVVTDHIQRKGLRATLDTIEGGFSQIGFAPSSPRPLVSILIPSKNNAELLRRCVQSIETLTEYPSYEIAVIDNGSTDASALELLQSLKLRDLGGVKIHVRHDPHPFNFARMNNSAARSAPGQVLCFLNDDTEVISPGWLSDLVGALELERTGAVGAQLLYPSGIIQHAGTLAGFAGTAINLGPPSRQGEGGYFGQFQLARRVSAVTAACMVTRKETFLSLNGFDEGFPVAFNDVDYCLRLQSAGLHVLYCPTALLRHHESATLRDPRSSSRREGFEADSARFADRWGAVLESSVGYSPNLALEGRPYDLAAPPRSFRMWHS